MSKTTELVGTIKGLHHKEDLIDILSRITKGESIETIAAYYDKRPSQIKKFAEENGIEVSETEYNETVDDVLDHLLPENWRHDHRENSPVSFESESI